MELLYNPLKGAETTFGDVHFGYFVPTVICGRTKAFQTDLQLFISNYCNQIFQNNFNTFLNSCLDFGLEGIGLEYRNRMFSKILVLSPKENLTDVWQILWGTWSYMFKNGVEEKSEEYNVLYKVSLIYLMFYLYFSQSDFNNLPIPLSIDTFEECLKLSETVLKKYKVTSVLNVLKYLINQKCITFTLLDGLQFLYQNKFGAPLKPPS
ncbi:small nuclear RNA activating complex (SNAPc) subunit SNAP43 [Theileria parva strain Muguga]|uniref:Uncharacterized protein n=1 Tax=Theileria parva TaxID=5875 RepID=Q4N706_THEPA|nr:small nuclear RNA activating complex (SNAPc) subunit SNAP43 [Theileria parva strain Muguga]EAN34252.1 small nuclear RNA activating complex (SNAPc) subunit SNAP43 [Theileria parva strain Muguga]|eukprot:XP_766535.1 hypothetical protein [Theileria parva strain Muguga]